MRPTARARWLRTVVAVGGLTAIVTVPTGAPAGADVAAHAQHSWLEDVSALPAVTFRPGSPPSGASFTPADRQQARDNGVLGPPVGPYFAEQPVQGVSELVPAEDGAWWALSDNGYGSRPSSPDYQLAVYRMDLGFARTGPPEVLETVVLSDPARHVPWQIVCDPGHGTPLPPLSFNVLPAAVPPACGPDPATARILTGFDFDPESLQVADDGSFWIGDEFGPFLLHADREGRLLDAPFDVPGLRSPQHPMLDVAAGERPTVAASRGFEGLALSPDGSRLHALLEGAVGDDDPQTVRIEPFDVHRKRFTGRTLRLRMEMPGGKVNLTTVNRADGQPAYPGTTPPAGTGGQSVAALTALDQHRFLLVERDGAGDALEPPRFKKVFVLDQRGAAKHGGFVAKAALIDLMAIPDPKRIGGDGDFFRFPFNTIESVHVVDDHTVLVANDNNFPFSTGRARSQSVDRSGPLRPDDNELILVRLGSSLRPDHRLLPGGG